MWAMTEGDSVRNALVIFVNFLRLETNWLDWPSKIFICCFPRKKKKRIITFFFILNMIFLMTLMKICICSNDWKKNTIPDNFSNALKTKKQIDNSTICDNLRQLIVARSSSAKT